LTWSSVLPGSRAVLLGSSAVLLLLEVCFAIDFPGRQYRLFTVKVPGAVLPVPGPVLPLGRNLCG
jgi:hypothetical protein